MKATPGFTEELQSTDSRALRSRDALCNALLRLLESQALDEISIRHIAAEAGVGHATFYRHYKSKEALLDDLAAEEMERLVGLALPVLAEQDAAASCLTLCTYVENHRSLWSTLLTGGAALAMKEQLLEISRQLTREFDPPEEPLPIDLRVTLSASAIVEFLAWWLRQADPRPVEEVARMLHQGVIGPQLQGFVPPA
ncbi:TetR/AcrR family transcriptional regulator [Haliea sp. E17]|uniref:TetR/AcrR family transcriptional regulator n=1 Tax=Haliea sp. E17 TaxID=3401576 RepID=UPI003AAE9024